MIGIRGEKEAQSSVVDLKHFKKWFKFFLFVFLEQFDFDPDPDPEPDPELPEKSDSVPKLTFRILTFKSSRLCSKKSSSSCEAKAGPAAAAGSSL